MTEYYQIPVKYIHSSVPKSDFSLDEINDLALAIINSGCLLEPLIVKQLNFQSYELLSGHRNYYAALKAKEIDIRVAEMVSVFVVSDENYDGVLKQIKLLSKTHELLPPEPNSQESLQILNAIHKLQSQTTEILQRVEHVESKVQSTIANTTSVVTPPPMSDPELGQSLISQLFTNLANGSVEVVIRKPQEVQQQTVQSIDLPDVPSPVTPLERFNTLSKLELMQAFEKAGITGKTLQTIVKNMIKAREEYAFTSYKDVIIRTDQMSEKKMLQILDYWSNVDKRPTVPSPESGSKRPQTPKPPVKSETPSKAKTEKTAIVENPIVSYDAFVEESMKILKKLNTDYNYDNLVPIYVLRRTLGDRVDRTQFNEWILEMHAQSVVELMGGNMPDLTPEIVEDSVVSRLGSAYYSVALD